MKRKLIIIIVAVIVVAAGTVFGINYWKQGSLYVTTDNANIGAPLISVSSLSAGQVVNVNVGIGDRVSQKQSVAEVAAPRFADSTSR